MHDLIWCAVLVMDALKFLVTKTSGEVKLELELMTHNWQNFKKEYFSHATAVKFIG